MVYFINNILVFIEHIVLVHSLVQLPEAEDNNIGITEKIIRDTTNNLFAAFKLRGLGHKAALKQYSTVHHIFVSITLKDADNLKEIARLTRVSNVDNNTKHFITQINAVLDEGSKFNDDMYLYEHLCDDFIKKLRYFNMIHKLKRNLNINPDILKHINNPAHQLINVKKKIRRSFDLMGKDKISTDLWEPSPRRIFQGKKIHIEEFPFMASILFFEQFQCAGSIIKSDLVITSASCLQLAWNNRLYRENPAFMSVRIGSHFTLMGGEVIPVLEINFQPLYDPKTLKHNLALIRLSRSIYFKNSRKVRKIEIDRTPRRLVESYTGRITILGWGATSATNVINHHFRNRLKYAELDYYPLDDCKQVYRQHHVTKRNFCAGFISQGGGACNYDAGGPGIVDDILMGVISFGSLTCGKRDSPTVFTKVGFYADWIDEIMDQTVPKTKRLPIELYPKRKPLIKWPKRTTFMVQPIDHQTSTLPTEENALEIEEDGFFDFLRTIFETSNSDSIEKQTNLTK